MVDQLAPEVLASKPSVKKQVFSNLISIFNIKLTYLAHVGGGLISRHERPGRQPTNRVKCMQYLQYMENTVGFVQ